MKKIFLLILMTFSLHAFNNPSAPLYIGEGFFISPNSWINIRLGYEGKFTGNARLNQHSEGSRGVDSFKINSNAGLVTINIKDRLDLYAALGTARIRADWRVEGGEFFNIEIESKYRFKEEYGARAVLVDWGKCSLGAGGSYSLCKPAILRIVKNGVLVEDGSKSVYRGWQVNSAISYRSDFLIPYVGIKYSSMEGKVRTRDTSIGENGSTSIHMKNRKKVGCIIGCGISNGKIFALNIEGCLIDEESISISGEFRF